MSKAPDPPAHRSSVRRLWSAALAISLVFGVTACLGQASPAPAPKTGPIATGTNSHVHTLVGGSHGSLVLGDQNGLWHSPNRGKTWKAYGSPLSHLMPLCVARVGTFMLACSTGLSTKLFGTPKGLWRSSDNGRHWNRTALPDLDVTVLAANTAVPGTVVAFARADSTSGAGHGGIWATRDSGKSWRRINSKVANEAPNGLALLPGKPFTVVFVTTQGLLVSFDGGKSWRTNSLSSQPALTIEESAQHGNIAYVGAANGVWLSIDSGRSWRLHWSAPPTPLVAPVSGLADGIYGYASTSKPYIYWSVNPMRSGPHSARIERRTAPLGGQQPAILIADPSNAQRLYAAYSFPLRIYESRNGARSWKEIL